MADELEDNLLLEEDGIAASGSEAGSELAGGDRAAEALQLPVAEGEDEAGEVYDNESLDGGDRNAKGAQQEGADAAQAKEDKKRKRKEKEKLRKQKVRIFAWFGSALMLRVVCFFFWASSAQLWHPRALKGWRLRQLSLQRYKPIS